MRVVRIVLMLTEWMRCVGVTGRPPTEEPHGKGKERERVVREGGVQCNGAAC